MGDSTQPDRLLAQEEYRVSTYQNHNLSIDKHALAKSGFYCTQKGDTVRCYKCKLEFDASKVSFAEIDERHKTRAPTCSEIENADQVQRRSKKFISYDSLRCEKERLETFINWPVSWLQPADLACDGFYYLRTEDHCACVFCRGIVGSWEEGDTPRGEHQRHFPHCPFIKGEAVGNIPIEQSRIISRLSPRSETSSLPSFHGGDVCGTGRLMSGSYSEKTGPPSSAKNSMNLEGMGLPLHSGPKRREYLTYESRLASFVRWPERVKQKPADLAEAGFFYCGLSDHVRCFHCGNGLRNWESDDRPWEEHARWYPECTFVLLKRGQEFIDKVRRERPPYIRTPPSAAKPGASNASSASASAVRSIVSDRELDVLMDLDIIKSVLLMGFPKEKVRVALRRKLEQTGLPFFSLEACIEAVLQYMEEESRQTLHDRCNLDVEEEATEQQAAKMESHNSSRSTAVGESTASQASTSAAEASSSTSLPSEDIPPAVSRTPSSTSVMSTVTTTPVTAPPQQVSAMSSLSPSSSSLSASSSISSLSSPLQESVSTTGETAQVSSVGNEEAMETEESVPARTITEPLDIITQANEVIGKAKKALKPSSGPPSLEQIEGNVEGPATADEEVQGSPSTSGVKKEQFMGTQMPKELAEELERKRELWMCKVCMDAEMEVVFLPCSHMVACSSCALALAQCPICREDIKYSVKPILS